MRHLTQSPGEGLGAPDGGSDLPQQEPIHELIRVKALATELDVSKHTIYRAIEAGVLRALRVGRGRGTLRIPVDAAAEYRALMERNAATKSNNDFLGALAEPA